MTNTPTYFLEISSHINCPLYSSGDQLALSDTSMQLPPGKATCLILARDITELLLLLKNNDPDTSGNRLYSCSGCQGIIKLRQVESPAYQEWQNHSAAAIGFSGQLQTLPPEELMQAINMNHKTGTLKLVFPQGTATVSFHDGAVVDAVCNHKKKAEAFFAILTERKGFFQFSADLAAQENGLSPIGDFMNLLMEGLQHMDEEEL